MEGVPASFPDKDSEITFWKQKAMDLKAQLEDTQRQFEEFQDDSRALEGELEQQLEVVEAKKADVSLRLERALSELTDLKEKLSKSRELSRGEISKLEQQVQQAHEREQHLKQRIRVLEQTNDDFERIERVTTTSLSEIEQRYNHMVERAILLEQELEDKQRMQVEIQRLKDEMRDMDLELQILRSKYAQNQSSNHMHVDQEKTLPTNSAPLEFAPSSEATSHSKANGNWNSSSTAIVQEMLSRVKTLERRLSTCRTVVRPLILTPAASSSNLE